MWTCQKCKHKFYNKNQSHSCGSFTIDNFLKGKTKKAIDLFNYFISEYKKIGELDIHPVKTRVALLTKMRFCSINKIGADYINVHLVFTKPYNDNVCFYKIENVADRFFLHHLKICNKSDINKEVRKYMKLAYEIGNRKHVEEKKKNAKVPIIRISFCWIILGCTIPFFSKAQDNYEIQVYGSQTVAKGNTMVELHSNYTFDGQKATENGVLPTNHVFHETVEITHGWTPWFETGFYLFNTIGSDNRTSYVGSHIRPRVMAPPAWDWPLGVSLSLEAGYQKREYSEDDWTLEIRPIVDKQLGKLYLSFNPTFDKSFHGVNKNLGYVFSPNAKAAYNITKVIAAGFEYYGSLGPLNNFQPYQSQQHQLFPAIDLDWSPDWELNFGYGWGFTKSTDNAIFKVILGYRFH